MDSGYLATSGFKKPSCGMRGSAAGDRLFPLLFVGTIMETEQNLNTGDSSETESKVELGTQNNQVEETITIDEPLKLDTIKDEATEDAFTLLVSSDEDTNENDNTNESTVENISQSEQKAELPPSASIGETNSSAISNEKVRRSGAARKRFRKLQNANEAANKHASPSTFVPKNKRPHSDDSDIPGASEAKQTKLTAGAVDRDTVMVGIIPSNYPETLFTPIELKTIQEAILDLIIEKRKQIETKPRFVRMKKQPGWLELLCANRATFEWLKDIENELKPWEGASIMVVHSNEIPCTEALTGKLPGSATYSNAKILGLIEAQNEGLDVTHWKIVHRTEADSNLDVTFSMDAMSFEQVKIAGFKIGYKFSQVNLHTKHSLAEKTQLQKARKQQQKPIGHQQVSGNQKWQPKPQKQQGQRWQSGPSKQQERRQERWPQRNQSGQQSRLEKQRQRVQTFQARNSNSSSSNATLSYFGQHNKRKANSKLPRRLQLPEHQFSRQQANVGPNTFRHVGPSSFTSQNPSQPVWENQPFKMYRSPFQQ